MCSVSTAYGTFKADNYYAIKIVRNKPVKIEDNKLWRYHNQAWGVLMDLRFEPKRESRYLQNAKIGLVQIVKTQLDGKVAPSTPIQRQRMTPGGYYIDRGPIFTNPIYGMWNLDTNKKLHESKATGEGNQIGDLIKAATLHDTPCRPGRGPNSGQYFETTAYILNKPSQPKHRYLGSVTWGWETDIKGTFKKLPFEIKSNRGVSVEFNIAIRKWNNSKIKGTIKAKKHTTQVYQCTSKEGEPFRAKVCGTIPRGTEIDFVDTADTQSSRKKTYNSVLEYFDDEPYDDEESPFSIGSMILESDNLQFYIKEEDLEYCKGQGKNCKHVVKLKIP